MIRYSFLIPFWNLETWMLQRMLDSIPHREDVEILLLDNASDDLDNEHFPGMNDPNTRVFFQTERKSVGYCRNWLIEQAQGEWIIFADADDQFFTENLNRLMDMPETSDYDLVYWGLQEYFSDARTIEYDLGYKGVGLQPIKDKTYIMAHRYESPHKMVRRSILTSHPDVRFDDMPIYEDVAFSIKLLVKTEKIGVYPPMSYQYIRRDTSTLKRTWKADVLVDVHQHLLTVLDYVRPYHSPITDQIVTLGCLCRLKQASRWHFCLCLFQELRNYGWPLFYRDLLRAGFETYETNIFKVLLDYLRVKIGDILHKK